MADDALHTQKSKFLFTGLIAIVVISLARYFSILQGVELKIFDIFLRLRPGEAIDERITIVEITDDDIASIGTYPIPDNLIADALVSIQRYEPRAIGLDILRDFPVMPPSEILTSTQADSYLTLTETIQNYNNIFVIDKILPPTISPPPNIPPEQVGFSDVILDSDGSLRRSLLGNPDINGGYRLSLTVLLAAAYLENEGIPLGNGNRDPVAIQFGDVELSSAHSNSRGYVTENIGPNPAVLINFRSGLTPFRKVSLQDLLAGNVSSEWFENRIVLIGITAKSVKDFVNSAATLASNPGLVSGVEI